VLHSGSRGGKGKVNIHFCICTLELGAFSAQIVLGIGRKNRRRAAIKNCIEFLSQTTNMKGQARM